MKISVKLLYVFALVQFSVSLFSQDTIRLANPSFEGPPRHSAQPPGWMDCGSSEQSPPDTHPAGAWGVSKKAYHGNTYLGMVTRNDATWESVGQPLERPLAVNQCYEFSAVMCMSEEYLSPTRRDQLNTYSFTTPVVLRVWGSNFPCKGEELLGESAEVDNTDWMKYNFKVKASRPYRFIILEAFYKTPVLMEYNGNILVDNLSALVPVECNARIIPKEVPAPGEESLAGKDVSPGSKIQGAQPGASGNKKGNPGTGENRKEVTPSKAQGSKTTVYADVSELKGKKIESGQIIRMDNLYFKADSVNLDPVNHQALDKIYIFLRENPKVTIEIGGHTNGLPKEDYCLRISEKRAKSVAEYLSGKGIEASRITYKGYGKSEPIADNSTREGRKKNQRVEVKILKGN